MKKKEKLGLVDFSVKSFVTAVDKDTLGGQVAADAEISAITTFFTCESYDCQSTCNAKRTPCPFETYGPFKSTCLDNEEPITVVV